VDNSADAKILPSAMLSILGSLTAVGTATAEAPAVVVVAVLIGVVVVKTGKSGGQIAITCVRTVSNCDWSKR
jgi:hypothetical protein